MGLHLPGASFVNPNTPLRDALTRAATKRALAITALGNDYTPVGAIVDERAIVNGVVGLHATGGSTNHTLHLVAMAQAAGIRLTWDDFADLSEVVPLLARVYPNGSADVNQFHAAGGMQFLIRELLGAGLLHEDVQDGLGHRPRRLPAGAGARGRRQRRLGRWRDGERATRSVLRAGRQAVLGRGRAQAPRRQSRPRGDQGLGGRSPSTR